MTKAPEELHEMLDALADDMAEGQLKVAAGVIELETGEVAVLTVLVVDPE